MIVEIDGGYHGAPDQKERDQEREMLITEFGYTFVRVTDQQVMNELPEVLTTIRNAAQIFIREENSRYISTLRSEERVVATP